MKRGFFAGILFFALIASVEAEEVSPKKATDGFIDLQGYYDTRNFSILSIDLLANLPAHFQYFSFVNLFNPPDKNSNHDLENYFTEQNLRWFLPKKLPFALTFQWAILSGTDNDIARFGFLWQLSKTPWLDQFFQKIHMNYFINFHALQIDSAPGTGWQIEHVYNITPFPDFFHRRVYIKGFADHNMTYGAGGDENIWATEHQLGCRLVNWFYAIAEFRRNEFMDKKNGVGLGLEYVIHFGE
ncbi:MAG: hypothetical protein Q7S98_06135 [Deltaproteobacteria bacterium]|nr:hypothetical protein [Deltaproteobacteria bacterium]